MGRMLLALALIRLAGAAPAAAELLPYEATLELRASSGQSFVGTTIVLHEFTGLADVSEGVVRIPAGAFSAPVSGAGFAGAVLGGALVLSASGAGPGSTCPLVEIQERCIPGGGFGGLMPLSGITQMGQALDAWGAGTDATGMTTMGLTRSVLATRWTTGVGQAWFYVPEIDPTPFLTSASGSFAGLPTTHTGTGPAGFRVVTPMVVNGSMLASDPNARGIAILGMRFAPRPVPLGLGLDLGLGLAAAFAAIGWTRLRARSLW